MAIVYPKGLEFIKGDAIDLKSEIEKGQKVFIFEFWATWCGPCRTSIPHLTDLQHKYRDKGVVFIGVTSEDEPAATKFVKMMGDKMDYHVALDATGDASQVFMSANGIRGIPHAFIVGKDGKTSWHGHPMDPSFETEIQKSVNKPSKLLVDPKSLSEEQMMAMSVKELKNVLQSAGIDYSSCVEKVDLVNLIKAKF